MNRDRAPVGCGTFDTQQNLWHFIVHPYSEDYESYVINNWLNTAKTRCSSGEVYMLWFDTWLSQGQEVQWEW